MWVHGAGAVAFPPTSWSLIATAAVDGDTVAREAVEALLRRYLPALRARLIIDRRIDPDRADDLLQGFVTERVLERGLLGRADRAHGRFRTYILTALDHYVTDVRRYEAAGVRTPGSPTRDIDAVEEPAGAGASSAAFDRAWAREVVAQAVDRVKGECREKNREDLWGVFEARVLAPAIDGAAPLPYDALVERFGLKSPDHASNVLMTGKRMFARALCAVIGEYGGDESDVRQEIAELRAALAGQEGRAWPRV